jgi:hypothetical protein
MYGAVLLMAAIAYWILQTTIIASEGPDCVLAVAVGKDVKGKISPLLYVLAIAFAFLSPGIANAIYTIVAIMWLVPDPRIERMAAAPGR